MTTNTKAGIQAQTDQLETVSKALTRFNATEAGLIDLHDRYDDATFEVETSKGMKLAKEARAEVRKPRFNVEKLRKAAKAPILELGRMIDADAKSLTLELLAIENPIDNQIKTAERIEARRISEIDACLGEFGGAVDVVTRYNPTAEKIGQFIADVEAIEITAEKFMEFEDDAHAKKNGALETLRKMQSDTAKAESDAAELAALRQEKQERDQADAETARLAKLAEEAEAETVGNDVPPPAPEVKDTEADALPSIEDQLQPTDEAPPEIDESLIRPSDRPAEIDAHYPGRAGIVHAVATSFGVSEAIASGWIEKLIEAETMPF